MKWVLLTVFSLYILSGCATLENRAELPQEYEKIRDLLENTTIPVTAKESSQEIKPIFKEVSPLKKTYTVAFFQENFENILFFVAYEAGLSLVIDPRIKRIVDPERARITLQMKQQPLERILDAICEAVNLGYRIEKGILYIEPYMEKTFSLNFLPLKKGSTTSLGGDVLGGVGTVGGGAGGAAVGGGGSPLKGDYKITSTVEEMDIYKMVEDNVKGLLSPAGKYQLNKFTGTLIVKDTRKNIKVIENFLQELKKRYEKQVIITAEIIEIELNKDSAMGINMFEITNWLMGNNRVDLQTLDFRSQDDFKSFSIAIQGMPNMSLLFKLLKKYGEVKILSKPVIRAIHGQPAILSTGTSYGYIQSVQVVSTGNLTSVTVTPSSVFDGILLGLIPFIEPDQKTIALHVVPIKSELIQMNSWSFTGYQVQIPQINLREMSSIIRVNPGDTVIIGGLILEKKKRRENRVGLPILENIFRNEEGENKKSEFLIMLRANII